MGIGTPITYLMPYIMALIFLIALIPQELLGMGLFLTDNGIMCIGRKEYKDDTSKVEKNCICTLCKRYSRGYLRHLIKIERAFWNSFGK